MSSPWPCEVCGFADCDNHYATPMLCISQVRQERDQLAAEVERLKGERDQAFRDYSGLRKLHRGTCDQLKAVLTEADRLRAALKRYGRHGDRCHSYVKPWGKPMPCDCGFEAALAGSKEGA